MSDDLYVPLALTILSDINFFTFTSVDCSHGRVVILDGDIFYSPNCSQDVELHPGNQDSTQQNIFSACLSPWRPRWWTQTFRWIAFIPISPIYRGFPFDSLATIPSSPHCYEDGYGLHPSLQDSWAKMEYYLHHTTALLANKYCASAVHPFSLSAYGYHPVFKNHRKAVKWTIQAREWFSVWIGLMSFLIASSQSFVENKMQHTDKPPL